MGASPSIAQEFYKVQELWRSIDSDQRWRLAIWSVQYQDVDIVDKFLEIERSPIGIFDDIFFRFETEYRDDDKAFEKALWQEYIEWFEEKPEPENDIIQALKNDGMMIEDYQPDRSLNPTAGNLWKEMLRFKSSIRGLENDHFCVYIPPTYPDGPAMTGWFSSVVKAGIPKGIRLVTIDFAPKPKVKLNASVLVTVLEPELNMAAAISNEMDKASDSYDSVGVENRFRKQIRKVMDCIPKKSNALMDKEVKSLLSLSKEMGTASAGITCLLVASQAYFSIGSYDSCEYYVNEAIVQSEEAIKNGEPTGYPIWRASVFLKAALMGGRKKRKEAIELYEMLAEKAAGQADAFYAMEGYRLAGYFYYELGEYYKAFDSLLLSLASGAYLEQQVRRQSSFLHSAALALYIGKDIRQPGDIKILEDQLAEWLGRDWRSLVESDHMKGVKKRRKSSILS